VPSSSKFDSDIAERLYNEGFGPCEEVGDVAELGWFGLYEPSRDDPEEWLTEPVILMEDNYGFVYTIYADHGGTIKDKWKLVEEDYDEFYNTPEEDV
jgi:hypothetical protein